MSRYSFRASDFSVDSLHIASFVIIAVACAGCGGRYASVDMRGRVTVDDQAASAGHLTFLPTAKDRGKGGMAAIQSDGSYLLRGVPLGEVIFMIAPQTATGKKTQALDPAGNKVSIDEVVPMITGGTFGAGQTTVTLEVSRDKAQHDFQLTNRTP